MSDESAPWIAVCDHPGIPSSRWRVLEGTRIIAANLSKDNARSIACADAALVALTHIITGCIGDPLEDARSLARDVIAKYETPHCLICGQVRDGNTLMKYEEGMAHADCIQEEQEHWNNRETHL